MSTMSPMLVTPATELPVGDWAYELKWDGMRAQPGEATCPQCGLSLYLTADGQLGRIPNPDWQPGGIQGRLR